MKRIPVAAAALVMAGCLAACGTKEPSPWSQITPVPTSVAPPTFTIRWETGGTPPTDPRQRAVWDYNIELGYADNTRNFTRPELRESATDAVIRSSVQVSIEVLYGYGNPVTDLGVYIGPVPIVFQKDEHDPHDADLDWVYYCEGSSAITYGHTAPATYPGGTPIKIAVSQGTDGRWRVNGVGDIQIDEERCSLEGASIGYYEPEPVQRAAGTYSLSDLKAPEWALPKEWKEAVG